MICLSKHIDTKLMWEKMLMTTFLLIYEEWMEGRGLILESKLLYLFPVLKFILIFQQPPPPFSTTFPRDWPNQTMQGPSIL
jgi:hypothetical protein